MRSNPVRIGLLLTDEEYAKFRAACEKADTFPSKAAREAVLEWTEDTLGESDENPGR